MLLLTLATLIACTAPSSSDDEEDTDGSTTDTDAAGDTDDTDEPVTDGSGRPQICEGTVHAWQEGTDDNLDFTTDLCHEVTVRTQVSEVYSFVSITIADRQIPSDLVQNDTCSFVIETPTLCMGREGELPASDQVGADAIIAAFDPGCLTTPATTGGSQSGTVTIERLDVGPHNTPDSAWLALKISGSVELDPEATPGFSEPDDRWFAEFDLRLERPIPYGEPFLEGPCLAAGDTGL